MTEFQPMYVVAEIISGYINPFELAICDDSDMHMSTKQGNNLHSSLIKYI